MLPARVPPTAGWAPITHISHTSKPGSREAARCPRLPAAWRPGRPLPLQAPASSSLGKNKTDTRPRDSVGWACTSSSPCFLRAPAATALGRGYWLLDTVWAALFMHLLSPGRWLPKHWVPRVSDGVLPRPLPWPVPCSPAAGCHLVLGFTRPHPPVSPCPVPGVPSLFGGSLPRCLHLHGSQDGPGTQGG